MKTGSEPNFGRFKGRKRRAHGTFRPSDCTARSRSMEGGTWKRQKREGRELKQNFREIKVCISLHAAMELPRKDMHRFIPQRRSLGRPIARPGAGALPLALRWRNPFASPCIMDRTTFCFWVRRGHRLCSAGAKLQFLANLAQPIPWTTSTMTSFLFLHKADVSGQSSAPPSSVCSVGHYECKTGPRTHVHLIVIQPT